ncbi:Solute carrier 49 member 4, partial [Halocaridina rubra]
MILGLIPITILLQLKGLRVAIIVTASFMALGTAIRCFTMEEESFRILAHAGAILNGFAGIAIGAAPALLSSRWFPPNERTTATGIGCTFNQLGNAGGFFLGPWLIRYPQNHSKPENATFSLPSLDDNDIDELRREIRDYMFI